MAANPSFDRAVAAKPPIQARMQAAVVRTLAATPQAGLRKLVGRPVVIDGQQLDVEAQLGLKLLALAGEQRLDSMTVADARSRVVEDARAFRGPQIEVARVHEVTIPATPQPLAARLYVPHASGTSAADGPMPTFQLLFYPWLDLSAKRSSYRLFGDGFYLTEAALDWYKQHYVERERDALDPRCSPLLADDLGGAAPAYIATAGFDPLRDDGEEYAERLRAAGVRVAVRRHAGLIHGFVNTAQIGRVAREAVLEAAGALRVGLAV